MTSVESIVPTTKATATSAAPDFASAAPDPSKALAIFGPPPLLHGENAADYNVLLSAVSNTVRPIDFFEQCWVRDVVDFIWLLRRYRRYMTELLNATKQKALELALEPLLRRDEDQYEWTDVTMVTARVLACRYVLNKKDTVEHVEKLLASAGMTWETVQAEAFKLRLAEIERIDRLIMTIEARRDATLREIDRHRMGFGQKLRRAVEQVEDASYRVIEQKPDDEKHAA
jgi:hypothetical protein